MNSSQNEAVVTMMPNMLNPTDVALVNPQNLALAMQHMIDTGRGLTMLRGITKDELNEVNGALAGELGHDPAQRLAVLMRLRCLIEVFRARRLADLLMHTGFNLIAPAVQIAASMRLNSDRGFNPVKFERALLARTADAGIALAA